MKFYANAFLSRRDLEDYIRIKVGTNPEVNLGEDHIIEGKREDLKKLGLSDTNSVFGCRVEITDTPTDQIIVDKIKKSKKPEKT
jgi:hypothetical protein